MPVEEAIAIDHDLKVCIENCQSCHAACLSTAAYCLERGGRHAEPDHLRLLLDCADICATSANFMLRGSDFHSLTCGVCAVVCERCAEACARMSGDAQMRACAETCRRCAKSCREMSQGA
jgi:hypothetical protein